MVKKDKFDTVISVKYYQNKLDLLKQIYGKEFTNHIRLLLDSMLDKQSLDINLNIITFKQKRIQHRLNEIYQEMEKEKKSKEDKEEMINSEIERLIQNKKELNKRFETKEKTNLEEINYLKKEFNQLEENKQLKL